MGSGVQAIRRGRDGVPGYAVENRRHATIFTSRGSSMSSLPRTRGARSGVTPADRAPLHITVGLLENVATEDSGTTDNRTR